MFGAEISVRLSHLSPDHVLFVPPHLFSVTIYNQRYLNAPTVFYSIHLNSIIPHGYSVFRMSHKVCIIGSLRRRILKS